MINKKSKILIIGNTGFIGCWLTLFLKQFSKNLYGLSLNTHICNNFSLYNKLKLNEEIHTQYFDISENLKKLSNRIDNIKPDIIYYLASQTLVLESYKKPKYSFKNNINSLVNFMESIRKKKFIKNVIIFTSDKCYINTGKKLDENSPLGGDDPYSASKASKEIIINSYVKSFSKELPNIISIRAGNIIGGGDWNSDRIIPDIFKAKLNKKKILLRNPQHSRPWQHVISPIYVTLLILKKINKRKYFFETFNIGPDVNNFTVGEIVNYAKAKFDIDFKLDNTKKNKMIEKKSIKLSNKKSKNFIKNLHYKELSIIQTLDYTFDWYLNIFFNSKKTNSKKYTNSQIKQIFTSISSKV